MVRHILEWCDEVENDWIHNGDESIPPKVYGAWFIEGAIDGAAAVGLTCAALGIVGFVKSIIKK